MARKFATTAALLAAVLLAAAASPAAAADAMVGYIPPPTQGCPPNVLVKLKASTEPGGWFSGPSVAGRVTILNGASYSVPVQKVLVMVFPSNSPVAPTYSTCYGIGSGSRVPFSPIPYQYGKDSCTFEAALPQNGPSAGARNWQTARAVVTLTGGAQCFSDMTPISSSGGWPWSGGGGGSWVIGGANPGASPGSGGGGGWPIGGANPSRGGGWGATLGGSGSSGSSRSSSNDDDDNDSSSGSGGSSRGGGLISGSSTTAAPPKLLGGGGGRKMLHVPVVAAEAA